MTQSPNSRAVRRLCVSGVLGALALALSYLESLIPLPIPLPGVKLGLGNLCVLLALYLYSWRWAGLVLAVKALLSSLLFAGLGALPYALCGGCLALLVMACLKPCRALRPSGFPSRARRPMALARCFWAPGSPPRRSCSCMPRP